MPELSRHLTNTEQTLKKLDELIACPTVSTAELCTIAAVIGTALDELYRARLLVLGQIQERLNASPATHIEKRFQVVQ